MPTPNPETLPVVDIDEGGAGGMVEFLWIAVLSAVVMILIANMTMMGFALHSARAATNDAARITAQAGSGSAISDYVPDGGTGPRSAEDYLRDRLAKNGWIRSVGAVKCWFPNGNTTANSTAVCTAQVSALSTGSGFSTSVGPVTFQSIFGRPTTIQSNGVLSQSGANPNVQ